jgi:hypothetical protein
MCTYCSTKYYRKIYENHIGPIPTDETGRTYDIHHIDGNHSNNHPSNLKAVTIQEHYDIHYNQGDYSACTLMAIKLNMSHEEISELATAENLRRVNAGTHHLQKRQDGTSHASERAKRGDLPAQRASKAGKHHWVGSKHLRNKGGGDNITLGEQMSQLAKNGTHPAQLASKNGTHHWLGKNNVDTNHNQKMLDKGIHPSQIKVSCLCCLRTTSVNSFARNHINQPCKT